MLILVLLADLVSIWVRLWILVVVLIWAESWSELSLLVLVLRSLVRIEVSILV